MDGKNIVSRYLDRINSTADTANDCIKFWTTVRDCVHEYEFKQIGSVVLPDVLVQVKCKRCNVISSFKLSQDEYLDCIDHF